MKKKICKNCNHFDKCVRVYNPYSCCVDYEAKPLTNEEWFCGLSTEEKAKWFTAKACWIMRMNQSNNPKKLWFEWLKEEHKK